jgi:hypothetical protein
MKGSPPNLSAVTLPELDALNGLVGSIAMTRCLTTSTLPLQRLR